MLFFAVPIILETDTILYIWLKNPPEYASVFLKWIIISSFMDTVLANSLVTSMFATGNIKRYQIIVASIGCLVFPLSWIAFEIGLEPQFGYIIYFIIYTILLFVRLHLLRDMVKLPPMMYIRDVLYRLLPTMVISFAFPSVLMLTMEEGIVRFITVSITSVVFTSLSIYYIGFVDKERKYIIHKIQILTSKFIKQ